MVFVSFVESRAHLAEVRAVLARHSGRELAIVAKIESRRGVERLDEILEEADAVAA